MKIQGSDIKTLADVGMGNEARLPNDDKFVVTANSINKTLKDAIEDGDIGGGGITDITLVNNNTDPLSVADTDNQVIFNDGGDEAFYDLPASPTPGFEITFVQRAQLDGSFSDKMKIRPASGDIIKIGESLVENPGYLAIEGRALSVTLQAITTSLWVVTGISGREHRKNSSIGQVKAIGIVGRDTWTTLSGGTPEARAHHAGENLNGYGYIHLGAVGSNNYRSNSHQYNDSLNAWFITASAQSARWDGFCYTFNGFTYHVGNAFPHLTSHDRYNDATNTWTTRQPFNANGAVSAGPGLGLNGYGIIFNNVVGAGGSYTSRYNDATNAWNSLALRTKNDVSIPFRNGGPSAFNGYAYRVAGFLDPGNFNTISTSEQYNDSGNFWIQKANSSIASGAGTYMNLNGNLILVHGITNPGSILRSSVEQYNDSLNTFTSLTPAANSKAFRGGFSSSGYGYIAGGENGYFVFTGMTSAAYQYN